MIFFSRLKPLSRSWYVQFTEKHSMYHQIPLILGGKKDFLKIGIHFQQFPFVSSWRPNNIIFKIIFTDLATLKGKPSGETALMHPLVRCWTPLQCCLPGALRFRRPSSYAFFPHIQRQLMKQAQTDMHSYALCRLSFATINPGLP